MHIKFFNFNKFEQQKLKVLKNAIPKFDFIKKSYNSEKHIKFAGAIKEVASASAENNN